VALRTEITIICGRLRDQSWAIAAGSAAASGYLGLIASYHLELASGPTIIMTAAILYGFSIFFAPSGLARRFFPRPHLKG